MKKKYFGTDGIRGKVGNEPMTVDFVLRLAFAVGEELKAASKQANPNNAHAPRVLIGKDTRISGYMFEAAMEAGFSAAGVDVILAGPIPTPAVAYFVRTFYLSAGVVISASHNSFEDNGIKFFSADGKKTDDAWELRVEARLQEKMNTLPAQQLGRAERLEDATGRYVEFCKSTFPSGVSLYGKRIVLDCAHGAAYRIAPLVLKELGADVITIADKPDGININHGVGATAPEYVLKHSQAQGADVGISLDGDADRLIMVEGNRVFDGDELLYAIIKSEVKNGTKVTGAVGTVMSNGGLEIALKKLGVSLTRTQVGDKWVLEELQKQGWHWGAESSGHILCLDKHSSGDGIIAALRILAIMVKQHTTLAEWLSDYHKLPQITENINISSREAGQSVLNNAVFTAAEMAVRAALGEQGRLIVRPSGTEAKIRITVEAPLEAEARRHIAHLAQAIHAVLLSQR